MNQNVLLVDDDISIVDGLKRVLRKEPYSIFTACSAAKALELLEGITFSVIVTDEEMPGMSGTDLLQIVRERFPETVRLMLTGKASLETALSAINRGEIYRFFTKPCNEIDLALAIRDGLKQRELISQTRRMISIMEMQSNYIDAIERENPGISHVERSSTGAVIINGDLSLDQALEEANQALAKIEMKFRR